MPYIKVDRCPLREPIGTQSDKGGIPNVFCRRIFYFHWRDPRIVHSARYCTERRAFHLIDSTQGLAVQVDMLDLRKLRDPCEEGPDIGVRTPGIPWLTSNYIPADS